MAITHLKYGKIIRKIITLEIQCSKKRMLTAWNVQNIFSLLRGVNSFWHHCIMVGVFQYILWLEVDVELFISYLKFPTPTPHFESCKLLKSELTCVKKTGSFI